MCLRLRCDSAHAHRIRGCKATLKYSITVRGLSMTTQLLHVRSGSWGRHLYNLGVTWNASEYGSQSVTRGWLWLLAFLTGAKLAASPWFCTLCIPLRTAWRSYKCNTKFMSSTDNFLAYTLRCSLLTASDACSLLICGILGRPKI